MSTDTMSPTSDSPTFDIEALVTADVLIDKLRALGATIIWLNAKPPQETSVELDVTIDAADAWELLPGDWTENDQFEDPRWRDVGDFIEACASGERRLERMGRHLQ